MKKYALMLAVFLACLTAFSGCENLTIKVDVGETSVSKEKSDDEKSEDEENENNADDEDEQPEKDDSQEQAEPEQTQKQADETEQKQADGETASEPEAEQEYREEVESIAEITDIEQIGEELFEKACKTQWDYLIGCPYELDYDDTYEYAVRVVGADSLADVLEDYNKVFTGDRPELDEKYISTQYALYCYDGGRGENIYYQNTDLELVSFEGDTAVFDAVSHYADPETYEPMEDEVHTFVIVRVDDEWRVSDFTLPY